MDKPKFAYWNIDLDTYIEICEIAKAKGLKPGDSMQEVFEEYVKKHPEKFKLLGSGNKDVDMMTGELRDKGKKIFNLKEWQRQQKKENDQK